VNAHQVLDDAADQAMSGRRVDPLALRRALRERIRRRRWRVVALVAACLLLAVPLAFAVARWSGETSTVPAAPAGRSVLPDRLVGLDRAPLLVDQSGRLRAQRLSMAFLGTVRGQLTPVGLDAATGRPVLLPVLGQRLPGLDDATLADVPGSVTPTSVSLSADGRTVAVSHQNAWDAYDLVLDLSSGRLAVVHQKAPVGRAAGEVLALAALDGGRFALPSDDLSALRVGQVGGGVRSVDLPGLDASRGLVVEPELGGGALVTARRGGRDWMWHVDPRTDAVTSFAAPWIAASGWSASARDDGGRLVSLVQGARLMAHDVRSGSAAPLGPVVLGGGGPRVDAEDLRVVSAAGGRVVLTDDGRQRTLRFVAGAQPHHLLVVEASGGLRTLTDLSLPASASGPGMSSLVVAQSALTGAQVVTMHEAPWWQSAWLWIVGFAALGLVVVALVLRGGRSAATDLPWQHSGPSANR
jgi:hypothetical protein